MDIFEQYERELSEKARKEIAEEDAKWTALTQEEKDKINKAREDKYANVPDEEPDLDSDDYEEDDEEEDE
jgi:hypothetical protein